MDTESKSKRLSVLVLHSPGCTGAEAAIREVSQAVRRLGLQPDSMTVRVIRDEEAAARFGMHGSPTVTVNGLDVDERMRDAPASLHG